MCTIQYLLPKVHKAGSVSGKGNLASTKRNFLRERAEESELHCFFNTSHLIQKMSNTSEPPSSSIISIKFSFFTW
jgi:hypothetical protein